MLAIRHWHVYLAGTAFVLNSDHNPLVHLRKKRDPTGKFARWIAELEEYNYIVRYIKGSDNVKADLLSCTKPAVSPQPVGLFDDKIYATTIDRETFRAQLQTAQAEDPIVSRVIQFIRQNQCIRQGRYKRIQNQLRIENDVLSKSGRPVGPLSLRTFVLSEIYDTAHFGVDQTYALIKAFSGQTCMHLARCLSPHVSSFNRQRLILPHPKDLSSPWQSQMLPWNL